MTPAERASTAWVVGAVLVPAGTPRAQRVVRLDPAFSRARGSPVEPRAIMVTLGNSYESPDAGDAPVVQGARLGGAQADARSATLETRNGSVTTMPSGLTPCNYPELAKLAAAKLR